MVKCRSIQIVVQSRPRFGRRLTPLAGGHSPEAARVKPWSSVSVSCGSCGRPSRFAGVFAARHLKPIATVFGGPMSLVAAVAFAVRGLHRPSPEVSRGGRSSISPSFNLQAQPWLGISFVSLIGRSFCSCGMPAVNDGRPLLSLLQNCPGNPTKLYRRHRLHDGLELSFTDKRRFTRVRLLKDPTSVPPISELDPDALLEPMTLEQFTESLRKKKTEIKALLLDQDINCERTYFSNCYKALFQGDDEMVEVVDIP